VLADLVDLITAVEKPHPVLRSELLEPLGPDGSRLFRTATFDQQRQADARPRSTGNSVRPHEYADVIVDNRDLAHPRLVFVGTAQAD
jgi:hypothetical protein